jgi:hypothetical protein
VPESTSGRDEERLQIVIAERTICNLVDWHMNKSQKIAFGRQDVNATFELISRFRGKVRIVQACSDIKSPGRVNFDSIRTAPAPPIKD